MAHAEFHQDDLQQLATDGPVDTGVVLRAIGALLVEESQLAFRAGGVRGGKPWGKRGVPNTPAILRALMGGATTWQARWLQPSPVLVGTGRLRSGFDFKVDEAGGSVSITNNVPYARDHHEGLTRTMPGALNEPIRSGLTELLRQRPQMAAKLGYLFTRKEITIRLPKRRLVEVTPPIMKDIEAIIAQSTRFKEKD